MWRTAFTVKIPWSTALLAALWPTPTFNSDYFMMVVAVLGTTISPYLFFWQASQEVEEMKGKRRRPLKELPRAATPKLIGSSAIQSSEWFFPTQLRFSSS